MLIKMERIVREYGKGESLTRALRGVSLQIEKGEFVAITGASGCGKSTLLNIMGGMDRQTEGEYYYENAPVAGLSGRKLARFRNHNIGFVFQSFHLAKELTAVENVALPLGYAGVGGKERKERARALLDRVGLSEKYKAHPTKLSGGEMQRFCIARALGKRTRFLLADEISTMLDLITQSQIWNFLVEEVSRREIGLLAVSHSMPLLLRVSTRICHLEPEK